MLGVYIHIPFCVKKCEYCDFFSVPIGCREIPHAAYLAAIACQLEREALPTFQGRSVSTVYFGGGTPSLMPPAFFSETLSLLRKVFPLDADAEVSCEVNPATADAEWFRGARAAGVTRVSIGVQSFDPGLLNLLGRIHSAEDAMCAIAGAQEAGFRSVSVDLMYAIPGETMPMLENDLRTAMTFQPQHVSAYQLTIEEGTPLHAATMDHGPRTMDRRKRGVGQWSMVNGRWSTDDDERELQQMRTVARMLGRSGWTRYEISNFAQPGHECRHNLNYWRYGEWLGLGAGATSFVRSYVCTFVRSSNPFSSPDTADQRTNVPTYQRTVFGRRRTQIRDVAKYIEGSSEPAEDEEIDVRTAMGEFCFLGLRTMEGISRERFVACFGVPFDAAFGNIAKDLVRDDLLVDSGERLALTPRGIELSNSVMARFVDETGGCHLPQKG